jgi:hypothetical protein
MTNKGETKTNEGKIIRGSMAENKKKDETDSTAEHGFDVRHVTHISGATCLLNMNHSVCDTN